MRFRERLQGVVALRDLGFQRAESTFVIRLLVLPDPHLRRGALRSRVIVPATVVLARHAAVAVVALGLRQREAGLVGLALRFVDRPHCLA